MSKHPGGRKKALDLSGIDAESKPPSNFSSEKKIRIGLSITNTVPGKDHSQGPDALRTGTRAFSSPP